MDSNIKHLTVFFFALTWSWFMVIEKVDLEDKQKNLQFSTALTSYKVSPQINCIVFDKQTL